MGTVGTTLRRLAVTAAVRAGAVLTGFAATGLVAGVAWGAQDVAISLTRPEGGDLVSIEGSISGIRAGMSGAPLRLTLRNPHADPRHVARVAATVAGVAGPPACTARFLTVRDWTGTLTVPAGGSATVTLAVDLDAALPPECANAAWQLAYTAF